MKREREGSQVEPIDLEQEDEEKRAKRLRLSPGENKTPSPPVDYALSNLSSVLSQFEAIMDLYVENEFHDVTFLVGNEDESKCHKMHAHRLILVARSEYYRAMFRSGFEEAHTKRITIHKPDVSPNVFSEVLRFLYCAKACLCERTVVDTWKIALELNIDDLFEVCLQCVKDNLSMQNVFRFFSHALIPNTEKLSALKNICLEFISEHTILFLETHLHEMNEAMLIELLKFSHLQIMEEDLFQRLVSWGKHVANCHPERESKSTTQLLEEILCNVVKYVRFPCMSIEFIKTVGTYNCAQ